MDFKKEGRLDRDEAYGDYGKLQDGTKEESYKDPKELGSLEDVEILRELLKEEGLYSPPMAEDVIEGRENRFKKLKEAAVEKEPREVYLQEQAVELLQNYLNSRFGYDFEDFPTERILSFKEKQFENLFSNFLKDDRGGLYQSSNRIAAIVEGSNVSRNLHVIIHELLHDFFINQQNQDSVPDGTKELFAEAVTEQLALEVSGILLNRDELFYSTKEWIKDFNLLDISDFTQKDFLNGLPSIANTVEFFDSSVDRGEKSEDHRTETDSIEEECSLPKSALFSTYAYTNERITLRSLIREFHNIAAGGYKEELEEDPLKVFVDYLAGKETATVHALMRELIGNKKFDQMKDDSGLTSKDWEKQLKN